MYFTNIKNNNGLSLQWDRIKSRCYTNEKNAIIFEPCNKLQEAETYIVVEFINGKVLTTTNNRKVIIL